MKSKCSNKKSKNSYKNKGGYKIDVKQNFEANDEFEKEISDDTVSKSWFELPKLINPIKQYLKQKHLINNIPLYTNLTNELKKPGKKTITPDQANIIMNDYLLNKEDKIYFSIDEIKNIEQKLIENNNKIEIEHINQLIEKIPNNWFKEQSLSKSEEEKKNKNEVEILKEILKLYHKESLSNKVFNQNDLYKKFRQEFNTISFDDNHGFRNKNIFTKSVQRANELLGIKSNKNKTMLDADYTIQRGPLAKKLQKKERKRFEDYMDNNQNENNNYDEIIKQKTFDSINDKVDKLIKKGNYINKINDDFVVENLINDNEELFNELKIDKRFEEKLLQAQIDYLENQTNLEGELTIIQTNMINNNQYTFKENNSTSPATTGIFGEKNKLEKVKNKLQNELDKKSKELEEKTNEEKTNEDEEKLLITERKNEIDKYFLSIKDKRKESIDEVTKIYQDNFKNNITLLETDGKDSLLEMLRNRKEMDFDEWLKDYLTKNLENFLNTQEQNDYKLKKIKENYRIKGLEVGWIEYYKNLKESFNDRKEKLEYRLNKLKKLAIKNGANEKDKGFQADFLRFINGEYYRSNDELSNKDNDLLSKEISNNYNKTNDIYNNEFRNVKRYAQSMMFAFPFVIIAAVAYLISLLNKKERYDYNAYLDCNLDKKEYLNNEPFPTSKHEAIVKGIQDRAGVRGTIISICLTFSAGIQALLKQTKDPNSDSILNNFKGNADENLLLVLYGFIYAAIIGYMGDQAYGTDEGYSLYMEGSFGLQLKYMFGKLTDGDFWRYVITVFLDMFISAPIIDVIMEFCQPFLFNMRKQSIMFGGWKGSYLGFIIDNFDNVLQSFVGLITFNAYTNDTRFKWAYPSNMLDKKDLINPNLIKLATVVAGLVYLFSHSGDTNRIFADSTAIKFIYFILVIMILSAGGSLYPTEKKTGVPNSVDEAKEGLKQKYNIADKWHTGYLTFVIVSVICVLGPVWKGNITTDAISGIMNWNFGCWAIILAVILVLFFILCQSDQSDGKSVLRNEINKELARNNDCVKWTDTKPVSGVTGGLKNVKRPRVFINKK